MIDPGPPLHLQALHHSFALVGSLPESWQAPLLPLVRRSGSAAAAVTYRVTAGDGRVELARPGRPTIQGAADDVLGQLLDEVRMAARGAAHHVVLHAAAVRRAEQVVLLPGASGSGKSTLTADLLRRGWQLLSDELVGLGSHAELLPCPLPLRLAPDACRRLDLPVPVGRPKADVALGALSPLPPAAGGAVTHVVFPRRCRGAGAEFTPLVRGRAVAALTPSVFAGAAPRESLAALASLTSGADCFELVSADPVAAVQALLAGLTSAP